MIQGHRGSPALKANIAFMKLTLVPIHPLPAGDPHPDFPKTILDFWLLTEDQLESIARHYDQITPTHWSTMYPQPMMWDKKFLARSDGSKQSTSSELALLEHNPWEPPTTKQRRRRPSLGEEMVQQDNTCQDSIDTDYIRLSESHRLWIKRRKLGRFIGLVGCDTPLWEVDMHVKFLQEDIQVSLLRERRVTSPRFSKFQG